MTSCNMEERRELAALLRREGTHAGLWFGDELIEAADLIEATINSTPDSGLVTDAMVEAGLAAYEQWGCRFSDRDNLEAIYLAMRRSSPTPDSNALTDKQIDAIQEAAMEATELYIGHKQVRAVLTAYAALLSSDPGRVE